MIRLTPLLGFLQNCSLVIHHCSYKFIGAPFSFKSLSHKPGKSRYCIKPFSFIASSIHHVWPDHAHPLFFFRFLGEHVWLWVNSDVSWIFGPGIGRGSQARDFSRHLNQIYHKLTLIKHRFRFNYQAHGEPYVQRLLGKVSWDFVQLI